jgi:hypothetical protein
MSNSKLKQTQISVTHELHLSGGLRAGTERSGRLFIGPTCDRECLILPVNDTHQYIRKFNSYGLDMIGYEEVSVQNDLRHSMWHFSDPNNTTPSNPLSDGIDIWSCLGNTALSKGHHELGTLARHISFTLRVASFCLRDISRQYSFQNQFAVDNNKAENAKFTNVEVFDLSMAIHSFLVEMGSARDYLAQFIARFILPGTDADKMSRLCQKLMKSKPKHQITKLVLQVCDRQNKQGWMARLSELRNRIVHAEPIRSIAESQFLKAGRISIEHKQLVVIYLGIPMDPCDDKCQSFVDALASSRDFFIKMLQFARSVANSSPLPAEVLKIPEKDLL